jgi:RNA polymerase sigma-70 factor, ECF subfamily
MHSSTTLRTRVTTILDGTVADGRTAVDQLVPLLYDELRELAHRQLRGERDEHTLQTTALVHEAYLKLTGGAPVTGRGRSYFFAAAAQAMRQVLVDRARRRQAAKRGGDLERVTLGEGATAVDAYAVELLELDGALQRLGRLSTRQVQVVELRFFAGMSVKEAAEALAVSTRTVEADWALARAWLLTELGR